MERHVIFHDRARDGCLFVRRVVDYAEELLKKLRPYQLARLALDTLPREVLLSVEHTPSPFDGMTAEELRQVLADVGAYRAALNAKQIEGKAEPESGQGSTMAIARGDREG